MDTRASALLEEFRQDGILTSMEGDDVALTGIASVHACGEGDLVFVDSDGAAAALGERPPAAAVAAEDQLPALSAVPGLTVLVAPNVRLAQALIRQQHADRDLFVGSGAGVHPSAIVGEDCAIGPGSRIGAHVVLGDGVVVGKRTAILAGTVVEEGAVIGDRVVIHPRVTIGYDCEIGDDVIVKSGAVIGSEGYGFAQDATGRSHRIPQTGKVVIEERVSIGAGTCVDRATFGETRIGAGTKFDNLCHVGHNVVIGRDCLFLAGTVIGGSCRIGDRCVATGQTAIIDHIDICSDVYLLRRAGVTENIDRPGKYAGGPVESYASYLRNTALAQNLTELRKQVRRLERALSQHDSKNQQ